MRRGTTSSGGALVVRCGATCSDGAVIEPRHPGRMDFVLKQLDPGIRAMMLMDPYNNTASACECY